jgi:uncharacterized protein (TIGR02284 family)
MASKVVDKINSVLQSEIAAVETYEQALQKIDDPVAQPDLLAAQKSHAFRAEKLKEAVSLLGGEPELSSGVKGVFAKTAEGTASLFGEKAAIAVLEDGEDRNLEEYEKLMNEPEEDLQEIAKFMLKEEKEVHDRISRLKKQLQK